MMVAHVQALQRRTETIDLAAISRELPRLRKQQGQIARKIRTAREKFGAAQSEQRALTYRRLQGDAGDDCAAEAHVLKCRAEVVKLQTALQQVNSRIHMIQTQAASKRQAEAEIRNLRSTRPDLFRKGEPCLGA